VRLQCAFAHQQLRQTVELKQETNMAPAAAAKVETVDLSKSADVVMVGCKLPHGLILEVPEPGSMEQIDPSSGKVLRIQGRKPAPVGQRYILKGANSMRTRSGAQGQFPYAITPVPRAFWERWLARYKDADFVTKGFVFAEDSMKDAQASAKEKLPEMTGMEAMAQDKDPRIKARARAPNAEEVETDQEALQRALSAST
jgi:hypothetical protein